MSGMENEGSQIVFSRSLEEVRGEIDGVDVQIATLLQQRLGLVAEASQIKDEQGLPIVDTHRELQILANVRKLTDSERGVRIFRAIIDECRIEQGAAPPAEPRWKRPKLYKSRGW